MTTQTIPQLFDLTGKTALVTGGALGIGQAIATRLSQAGATVMISDIDLEAAQETAKALKQAGGKAAATQADAGRVADAQKSVQLTVDTFGSLDILVNNAGIYPMSPMFDTTEYLWDKVMSLNVKGVFFHSQAAAQKMIDAGTGGVIVNLASIDALHPTGNLVHYDTSKGGVVMMTKALALELGPHNIRVNAVAPGGIQTPGGEKASAALLKAGKVTMEQLAAQGALMTTRIPLGRMGEPDDIAKVVFFLATDLSGYMTGGLVVADGGFLLS